jgi:hypothetical protein
LPGEFFGDFTGVIEEILDSFAANRSPLSDGSFPPITLRLLAAKVRSA